MLRKVEDPRSWSQECLEYAGVAFPTENPWTTSMCRLGHGHVLNFRRPGYIGLEDRQHEVQNGDVEAKEIGSKAITTLHL